MAFRYSGSLVVRCLWIDRTAHYECVISRKGRHVTTQHVNPSKHLTHAVDSPVAYDAAARAALAFAEHEGHDVADRDEHVSRTRSASAHRAPTACLPLVLDETVPWPPRASHVLRCRACAIRLAAGATLSVPPKLMHHVPLQTLLDDMAQTSQDPDLDEVLALTARAALHHALTWRDTDPVTARVRAAYARRPAPRTANAHRATRRTRRTR